MTMAELPTNRPLTVSLTNRQRTFRIKRRLLVSTAEMILHHAGQRTGELGVVLINDRAMRVLNAKYRGKSRTTDVLSFPQSLRQRGVEHLIGDVVISLQTATRQANARASTLHDEVVRLLVHGVLHLAGYDHLEEEDARKMQSLERIALEQVFPAPAVRP